MVLEYLPYIPLALFIIYIFKNPDKIEAWSAIFAKLFAQFSKRAEKHSISADIQSRLSSYIKNYSVEGVLPYGIKFKWIDGTNFDSYVEEGEVVVIMNRHENNARNFLNAVVAYTAQALFPNVRTYLPADVLTASEIIVQEKIIREKRPDALEMFKKEIIPERLKGRDVIEKMLDRLENMDRGGYFETVLLPELTHAGPRLQELHNNEADGDVRNLVVFLEQIMNRQTGDESTPLRYNGKAFRIAIVLIAKHVKIIAEGVSPYLKRVQEAIAKQYDSVYLLARGDNEKFMDSVIDSIKQNTDATFRWKKSFKSLDGKKRRKYATVCLFRL